MWSRVVCIFSCLKKYTRAKFLFLPSPVEINKTALKLRNICNFVYFSKHRVKRMNSGVRSNLVQILALSHESSVTFTTSFPLYWVGVFICKRERVLGALWKFGETYMKYIYAFKCLLHKNFSCQKILPHSSCPKRSPTPSHGSSVSTSQ